MSQLLVYFALLASIVVGQIFRIPLRPGSDLAIRSADLVVAAVDLGWILIFGWNLLKNKRALIGPLNLVDKLFLVFELILFVTFLPSLAHFVRSDLITGLGYLIRFQGYLLLYWVARSWAKRIDPTVFQRYFVWSAVIVAAIGFVQLGLFGDFRFMTVFGWDPHVGRLLSTFYDPNYVAIYLGLGLIAATAQALFGRLDHRRWYYVLGVVILIALYFTFSRSGVISTAIAMVLLGCRKNWKAALAIAAIFAVVMFLPGRSGSRFTSLLTTTKLENTGQNGFGLVASQDDTGSQRILSWKRAWAVIKTSPIYGVGYNNFGAASVAASHRNTALLSVGSAQASDSSLLDIWATTGLIGLATILWFAWKVLSSSALMNKALLADPGQIWRLGYGFGLLALGINTTFINSLLYPQLLIYWVLFAGILVSFAFND